MWTRRRTWRGKNDDWLVFTDRRHVGRVYLGMRQNPQRDVWLWFYQLVPAVNGEAGTMEEALEAVRSAHLRRVESAG